MATKAASPNRGKVVRSGRPSSTAPNSSRAAAFWKTTRWSTPAVTITSTGELSQAADHCWGVSPSNGLPSGTAEFPDHEGKP